MQNQYKLFNESTDASALWTTAIYSDTIYYRDHLWRYANIYFLFIKWMKTFCQTFAINTEWTKLIEWYERWSHLNAGIDW